MKMQNKNKDMRGKYTICNNKQLVVLPMEAV